jgi:hypothetical protein
MSQPPADSSASLGIDTLEGATDVAPDSSASFFTEAPEVCLAAHLVLSPPVPLVAHS